MTSITPVFHFTSDVMVQVPTNCVCTLMCVYVDINGKNLKEKVPVHHKTTTMDIFSIQLKTKAHEHGSESVEYLLDQC